MMSYKDRTFCTFYKDCDHQSICGRPLTPSVLEGAERWWGAEDPPINIFVEKPKCHSDFNKEEDNNETKI